MKPNFIYRILDFSNYDGDSIDLTLDLGFDLVIHIKSRLLGVDTPELRGGTPQSKAAGQLAKKEVHRWIQEAMEKGAYFVSQDYRGKFGRPLGDIVNSQGHRLTDHLLSSSLAANYHGQNKEEIAEQHRVNLETLIMKGLIDA